MNRSSRQYVDFPDRKCQLTKYDKIRHAIYTKCRILVYDANVYETHKIATGGKRKRSSTSVSMGLRNKNESVASHIKCRQLSSRTPMGREPDRSDVFK